MADTIFLDHPASGILLEPEGEVHGWFATSQDHALRIRINGQDVEPFSVDRPDVQAAHLTARTGGFGVSYGPFEGEGRIELQIGDALSVLDFRQREGTKAYDAALSHADHRYRTPTDLRVTDVGPRRIILQSSCQMASLVQYIAETVGAPAIEHHLINNVVTLPDSLSQPFGDYDFQIIQVPIRPILQE